MARDLTGVGVELEECSIVLGGRRVVDRASLRIEPGDKCLVVGPNGAGKTQLIKLLTGICWPTPTGRECRRWFDAGGHDLDLVEIRPRIAYVGAESQDRYRRHGWNHTLAQVVATGFHGTDIPLDKPGPRVRAQVRRMLERFDLVRAAGRPMLEASYGERRLALIARALATGPRLLALDEAYNGLDAAHRAVLDRVLEEVLSSGMTLLLSAHRAIDAPRRLNRFLRVERGRCTEQADTPPQRLRRSVGPGKPVLQPARAPGASARVVLALRRATVHRAGVVALRDIDWTLHEGEHWAITGPNGSGKSTLLGALHGSHPIAAGGSLERAGYAAGTPLEELRGAIGLVSPELQADYLRSDTLLEVVVGGLRGSVGLDEPPTPSERRRARQGLDALGLGALAGRRAGQVSYGELRLALFARALVRAPRLLLLDEPLTGLDDAHRGQLCGQLDQLASKGVAIVMALHHRDDRPRALNRELRLHRGRIVERL
ncbi:MAG: ATP-binding cassette domain-containing protein [Steroidobacteraceae bacterium]|nr:ATP-binding cassette domain-containing protein [Steroidobacteraceae bacterium]